jgi:hypothetical protein
VKVSAAVQELERQYEAMRERAERAEGLVRVYEAKERGASIARTAVEDGEWRIFWRQGEGEETSFEFAPALWILGVAEGFARHPVPFELRVERLAPSTEKGGEGR